VFTTSVLGLVISPSSVSPWHVIFWRTVSNVTTGPVTENAAPVNLLLGPGPGDQSYFPFFVALGFVQVLVS